ncbi:MAG: lysophospholipid acyltransferase family protein [Longimicrobiales bacterium]|nr:lysophospholipid acyltransferase family protein [Longimicrobiales bacterium]
MNIRGALTILITGLALVVCDLVQRTLIAGATKLFPARRDMILSKWQQRIARGVLWTTRHIGGATIEPPLWVPAEAGTLVLMNHQSLLDIPLVVRSVRPTHPRIVTRSRYAYGKPLISHMVRLYQYPLVDPKATTRSELLRLAREAAASPVPVALYPEGTRTRDGSIGRFRRAGLATILAERRWTVYVVTIDGYWMLRSLGDFLKRSSRIRGTMRVSGPFASPEPAGGTEAERGDDFRRDPVIDAFIDTLEGEMQGNLAEIRSGGRPAELTGEPGHGARDALG